jgi:hypothetical protein
MSPPLISDADDGDSPIIAGGLTAGALLGKIGTGWFHVLAVCALGLANAADAVEVLCIGFILPQEEVMSWVSGVGSGALSATVFGGMLLGGLLGKVGGGMLGGLGRQAVSSGMSFATTYALGHVAKRYYAGGRVLSAQMLKDAYAGTLQQAQGLQAQYLPAMREQARTLDTGKLLSMVRGR